MAEPVFLLYSTGSCHLCEQAEALLAALPLPQTIAVDVVDISDDDALLQRYGHRIPVLASAHGDELAWPFDSQQTSAFIQRNL